MHRTTPHNKELSSMFKISMVQGWETQLKWHRLLKPESWLVARGVTGINSLKVNIAFIVPMSLWAHDPLGITQHPIWPNCNDHLRNFFQNQHQPKLGLLNVEGLSLKQRKVYCRPEQWELGWGRGAGQGAHVLKISQTPGRVSAKHF